MIRAHIAHRFLADVLDVYIVDHLEGRQRLLTADDGRLHWREWQDDGTTAEEQPTLRLPGDSGRALLDALVHHYQGAEDTRALRRDYDNERKRVDELTQVIADVTRTLAHGGPHG